MTEAPSLPQATTPGATVSTDHTRAQLDDRAHTHGRGTGASRADRLASYQVDDFAVPNGREEEWRFTPIRKLTPLFTQELASGVLGLVATVPDAVRLENVPHTDARLGLTAPPGDRISAAAWSAQPEATVVTIPAGTALDEPAYLRLEGKDHTAGAHHLVIIAEEGSQGIVILEHLGTAEVSQNVEMVVRDGARLTVVTIQDWDADAVHAGSHRALVGRDAYLKHFAITLGGALVRLTPEASFQGPGGDVEFDGLYLTDTGQHHEHRLFVDHTQAHCRSRVGYKGALQGAGAHSVWVGDVLIRTAAEGTDTYEYNRNLVLTEGARADSVPNLEIETGEIEGAGHASATGRFDDEQLFYLMARGIEEAEARRLVVHGFFAELIQRIGVPSLEERLIAAVDAQLERSVGDAK